MSVQKDVTKCMDAQKAKDILSLMLHIRRFEERTAAAYREGYIGGFCHLYIGQEAVVVGAQQFFQEGDAVITSYRDHAHMLACGMDPRYVMAELFGRVHGYSKGKGGSMHMFSVKKGFFGGHGIVGAQVPLGNGLALARKMQGKTDSVTFTYFGDGACSQGQVYESFNMANLYKLPILYIIENNGYAMGTSVQRHSSTDRPLHARGEPFNIPNTCVDGMDVLEVMRVMGEATAYVRKHQSPYLVEVRTYRHVGHSVSDPATYMPKDEKAHYKDRDPIALFSVYAKDNKLMTEEDILALDKKAKAVAKDSYTFAVEDAMVPEDELMIDILEEAQ